MNLAKEFASLASVIGCVGLASCASVPNDRGKVSEALELRTGHSLTNSKPGDAAVPADVSLQDGLNEEEAVALALWNNAAFHETLTKLEFSRADLLQAGLLSNPTLSVLFPLGPKQLEFAATFPLEAVWLRPRRMAIARLDAARVADSLIQNGLDLVRDVRAGLSDLGLAMDKAGLGREAMSLRERIAQITEARQRAGEGSELETAAAQAEVVRARDEARRLEHDVTVARERLLHLVGLNSAITNVIFSASATPPMSGTSVAELERRALAARPDVRASELVLEAAALRAGLARAEIFALSGIIDANASGKEGFEIGPGLQAPIPIFNQNQAGRARAAAEMDRAAWNCVATRRRVTLEVREAHTKYQQAAEAFQSWSTQLVPTLEELVRRSEKAYELGELSPLTVQENARQLLDARVRQAELAADLRRSQAELERSVGTRLPSDSK